MRFVLAFVAGIIGAVADAGLLGMLLAFLPTEIYGRFEGASGTGGFGIGMTLGALFGFMVGLGLIVRAGAPAIGKAAAWTAAAGAGVTAISASLWEYA